MNQLSSVNAGDIIYYEEDVFVLNGNRNKFLGKRCSIGKVVRPGIVGEAIWKIMKSAGVHAYPIGAEISKPVVNLMRGKKCNDILFDENFGTDKAENFKPGGHLEGVENGKKVILDSAKKGGMGTGAKHTDGGIKGSVGTEKKPIEFEGEEIILTAPVSSSSEQYDFEGKKMTAKEIASQLNVDNGGVAFADGGQAKSCRCTGKKYKFGGETFCDRDIVNYINYMSQPVTDRIITLKNKI